MLEKIIELSKININGIDSSSKGYEKNAKIDEYYRTALTKIHNEKWISWNWSAFFLSPFRMLYRNMLFLPLIIIGIDIIAEFILSEKLIKIIAKFAWSYLIFFGLFSNKIYYHHLKRKAKQGYTRSMIQATNNTFKKIFFLLLSLLFTLNIVFLYLSKNNIKKNLELDHEFSFYFCLLSLLCIIAFIQTILNYIKAKKNTQKINYKIDKTLFNSLSFHKMHELYRSFFFEKMKLFLK